MRLLGATVRQVDAGSKTLKDAINEAMRDWVANVGDTYYLLGSALGPHPYPLMVREFQSVIGREARAQMLEQAGRLPHIVVACVGGGSNAIGIFDGFLDDRDVRLIGVEAGGERIAPGRHAARFAGGSTGVLQGTRTFVLQDEAGNIELTHSISAGLDYAAIGPEHAWLRDLGRTEYAYATDAEALEGFQALARLEGILPALESAHAVAHATRLAKDVPGGHDHADQPVRPRRQGRAKRERGAAMSPSTPLGAGRLSETFARIRAQRLARPGDLHHRRRSGSAAHRRHPRRARSRGRRRPRSRRAVLGSAGRRPGDSARDRAGAGRRARRWRRCSTCSGGVRSSVQAPIVIFSYANPILRLGAERFADRAREAGVDGVLVLDLPIEEADEFRNMLAARGIDTILLLSPTTTDERLRRPRPLAAGFCMRFRASA